MIRRGLIPLLACAAVVFGSGAAFTPTIARADNVWVYSCGWWGNGAPAFTGYWGTQNLTAINTCSEADKALKVNAQPQSVAYHALAGWYTTSPSGVQIDYAYTPANSMRVSCGLKTEGYGAWWAISPQPGEAPSWQGEISQPNCGSGMGDGGEIGGPLPAGQSFQYYVWCLASAGCGSPGPLVEVQGIELGATETVSPLLTALGSNNLFYQGGRWVRGAGWPISLQASDPTGACDMQAWVNGQLLQGPATGLDQQVWDQCDPSGVAQQWASSLDTTSHPNGPLSIQYRADNAAGLWSASPTATSYIDNTPVELTLTGPANAATTAGTQHVTATATAGPSGVGAVMCSVDGSPSTAQHITGASTQTATAQVPVSGLGSHQVSCHATNRALDARGTPASSPTAMWSVKIGEPVIVGISFSTVIRHCGRVLRRVTIPAHWATVRRRHKRVRVRVPARTRREWVTACKVRSRAHARKLVAFGHGATVSGWLETSKGAVVAGAPVSIMTAANDGLRNWRQAAVVTTSADGGWSARLRPGPSRLVEAVYPGGALTEPATSRIVTLNVPARIDVSVSPHVVPWGHSITIRGRLLGGYVPRDGVALRLLVRYVGSPQPTDLLGFRTSRKGTFRIPFAFGAGNGVETLPIWVATTATESDYPFAAAASKKISVTFGRSRR